MTEVRDIFPNFPERSAHDFEGCAHTASDFLSALLLATTPQSSGFLKLKTHITTTFYPAYSWCPQHHLRRVARSWVLVEMFTSNICLGIATKAELREKRERERERVCSSFLCESPTLSLLSLSPSHRVARIIPQSNGACSSQMGFPCIATAGHQPCLATEVRKSRLGEERERVSRDRTL